MKSKNIAIAAILAATLMGSAITAYSQPGPAGDMPEGMREMGGCMGEMPCPGMQARMLRIHATPGEPLLLNRVEIYDATQPAG